MTTMNLRNNFSICLLLALIFTITYSQNCDMADQTECQKCAGYYWYADSCMQCSQANTEYSCELCLGFYFKDNHCQSCSNITNPALCQQCSGYFFSAQQCQPCQLASAYLCILQCPNYYLRNGLCTHCSQARDQLTCKNCVAPFEFKGNQCVQCPKHYINNDVEYECMPCEGLNEARLCSSCPQFYFSDSSCRSCKLATNAKSCMLCPGFYFNGTNCIHCNEATQSSCINCVNHIFVNGFCTPCRLISDNSICQSCALFRYSIDRRMCVPCQQRGFYLENNTTCIHCSRSRSKETCATCIGFQFDSLYSVCLNCSEIIHEAKCNQCPSYFYSNNTNKCTSCKDADLLQCLVYCGNFYFKNKCVSCEQASTLAECRKCSYNYYWSSSRQCLPCKASDYFRKHNQCMPCTAAKNADQCSYCSYYYFSNSTCKHCKTATHQQQCNKCKSLSFFYNNASGKCDYCQIASESRCVQSNCPGYAYYNGSCRYASYIVVKSQCEKYPHFTFQGGICNFCISKSEYLDPFTNMCSKCQSFKNSSACSRCPHFFFEAKASSCKICKEANRQQCSSCYGYTFTGGSCKLCQYLTQKSPCQTCVDYFYVSNYCVKCQQAVEQDQCLRCRNFGFEKRSCLRCEKITDMISCEKYCKSFGYYPLYSKNLCLNCLHSSNKTTCDLCPNYYWSQTNSRCLSCSQNNSSCALCGGFMKAGQCQPCFINNCKSCSLNGMSCLQCRQSYVSQSNASFCRKNCSAPLCNRCDDKSSTFCVECKPDFLFSPLQGTCTIKCNVLNCLTCSSNSVCKQCSLGYTLKKDGRSCECNKENCQICLYKNNVTSCLSCLQGYRMNYTSNTCEKVKCLIDKCTKCQSSQTCLECQNGYRYLGQSMCSPICSIEGCSLCQTATSCQTCSKNYRLLSDLTCQPSCKIQNCERCASQTTCKSCLGRFTKSIDQTRCQKKCEFLGLFSYKSTCQTCQNIFPNCHTCVEKNQATECTRCLPTYGLETNSCIDCASNMPYCISCRKTGIVGFLCNQCLSGYSLINKQCRECSDNCLSCARRGEMNCDRCIEGYVYVIQAINAHKCKPCLNQCRTCRADDIRECYTCFAGFYLNVSSCEKCSNKCMKCRDDKVCLQCSPGSVMTPKGCVDLTIANCNQGFYVNQHVTCTSCKAGYLQQNGKCIESNCSLYKNCKECMLENYIKNGQCTACPKIQGCLTCQNKDPTLCKICNQGYYLYQNQLCLKCVNGCSLCTSSSLCSIASEGYYIEQSIKHPFKCSKYCSTCKGAYICMTCIQGFVQHKSKCIRKDSIVLNLTIQPRKLNDNKSKDTTLQKVNMDNWYNYYRQIIKFIQFEDIEDDLILDSLDVDKAKFGFVIALPIEASKGKKVQSIKNYIINGHSKLFKIFSFNIAYLDDSQKTQKQESSSISIPESNQSQKPSPSERLKTSQSKSSQKMFAFQIWAIITTLLLASATIVIIILLRRRSRVINNNNPEKVKQQEQELRKTTNCLQGKNYNQKEAEAKTQSIQLGSEQLD